LKNVKQANDIKIKEEEEKSELLKKAKQGAALNKTPARLGNHQAHQSNNTSAVAGGPTVGNNSANGGGAILVKAF